MDVKHLSKCIDDRCRSSLRQSEVFRNFALFLYPLSNSLVTPDASNESFLDPTMYVLEVRRTTGSLVAGTVKMVPMVLSAMALLT